MIFAGRKEKCIDEIIQGDSSSFVSRIDLLLEMDGDRGTHGGMRFRGEHLEAVRVWFRSPVLRVLLRPILSNALVTAVTHEEDNHNHPAEHRPASKRTTYHSSENNHSTGEGMGTIERVYLARANLSRHA